MAAQLVDVVVRLRELELKKAPSIAESVDWARTLIALRDRRPRRGHGRAHARRRAQARLRPARAVKELKLAAGLSPMSLLDTHIGFVEALRAAGLSVSLAEGLDAIARSSR